MSTRPQLYSKTTMRVTPRLMNTGMTVPVIPTVTSLPRSQIVRLPNVGPSIYATVPVIEEPQRTSIIQSIYTTPTKIGIDSDDEYVKSSEYSTATILTPSNKLNSTEVLVTPQNIIYGSIPKQYGNMLITPLNNPQSSFVTPRSQYIMEDEYEVKKSYAPRKKMDLISEYIPKMTPKSPLRREFNDYNLDEDNMIRSESMRDSNFKAIQGKQYDSFKSQESNLDRMSNENRDLRLEIQSLKDDHQNFLDQVTKLTQIKPPRYEYPLNEAGSRLISLTFHYPNGHIVNHSFDEREQLDTIVDTMRYDLKSLDSMKLTIVREGELSCGPQDSASTCGLKNGQHIQVEYVNLVE